MSGNFELSRKRLDMALCAKCSFQRISVVTFENDVIKLELPRSKSDFYFGLSPTESIGNFWICSRLLKTMSTLLFTTNTSFTTLARLFLLHNTETSLITLNNLLLNLEKITLSFLYCQHRTMCEPALSAVFLPRELSQSVFTKKLQCPFKKMNETLQNVIEQTSIDLSTCDVCGGTHETIVVDCKMRPSTSVCARQHADVLTSEVLKESILVGCTRRPILRKKYCADHLAENVDPERCATTSKKSLVVGLVKAIRGSCDGRGFVTVEYLVEKTGSKTCSWVNLEDLCIKSIVAFELQLLKKGLRKVRSAPEQNSNDDLTEDKKFDNAIYEPETANAVLPGYENCYSKRENSLRVRQSGGFIIATVTCGKILKISELVGPESLTKISFFLAELSKTLPQLKNVVYDHGCGLHRFVSAKYEKNATKTHNPWACLNKLHYYIDLFHCKTHTCVRKPEGLRYLPTNIAEMRTVNTEIAEQINAKIAFMCGHCSSMGVEILFLFLTLFYFEHNRLIKTGCFGSLSSKTKNHLKRVNFEALHSYPK
jgi:hypothetical protein